MAIPNVFITIGYASIAVKDANRLPEEGTGINILLDEEGFDMQLICNYIKELGYNYIYSLSAGLLNSSRLTALLPNLYLLYTLSAGFRKHKNSIPVFVRAAAESLPTIKAVQEYFSLQGEQQPEFTMVSAQLLQVHNGTLFINSNDLINLNEQKLISYQAQQPALVIVTAHNGSLQAAMQNNFYTQLLIQGIALHNDLHWRTIQTTLWQKRASLYLSFIALGKKVGEQEYYDITTWYHNEYEVLPLWFKRLGHIVKAFTGKRSFRSLFTDNVKKGKLKP